MENDLTIGALRSRPFWRTTAILLAAAGGFYLAGYLMWSTLLAAFSVAPALAWFDERRRLKKSGQWDTVMSNGQFLAAQESYRVGMRAAIQDRASESEPPSDQRIWDLMPPESDKTVGTGEIESALSIGVLLWAGSLALYWNDHPKWSMFVLLLSLRGVVQYCLHRHKVKKAGKWDQPIAASRVQEYAELLTEIRASLDSLSPGTVEVFQTTFERWKPDCSQFGYVDDYGPEDAVLDIWPGNERGARLQIAFGRWGIQVGIGSVSHLVMMFDRDGQPLKRPRREDEDCAAFESYFPKDLLLPLIEAAAQGNLVAEVTVSRGRIQSTAVNVFLPNGERRRLTGVGTDFIDPIETRLFPSWFPRRNVVVANTRSYRYGPWTELNTELEPAQQLDAISRLQL